MSFVKNSDDLFLMACCYAKLCWTVGQAMKKVTPASVHLYLPNDQKSVLPFFLSSSCIGNAVQRRWARDERLACFLGLDKPHIDLVDNIKQMELRLEFCNCSETLSSLMYVFPPVLSSIF